MSVSFVLRVTVAVRGRSTNVCTTASQLSAPGEPSKNPLIPRLRRELDVDVAVAHHCGSLAIDRIRVHRSRVLRPMPGLRHAQ